MVLTLRKEIMPIVLMVQGLQQQQSVEYFGRMWNRLFENAGIHTEHQWSTLIPSGKIKKYDFYEDLTIPCHHR